MKLSTRIAHCNLTVRGLDMSLTTDAIERNGVTVIETVIVCGGETSLPLRAESAEQGTLDNLHIAMSLVDEDHDADARHVAFIKASLVSLAKRHATMMPPKSDANVTFAPQSTPVVVKDNVYFFPAVRRQRTDTVPSPAPRGAA